MKNNRMPPGGNRTSVLRRRSSWVVTVSLALLLSAMPSQDLGASQKLADKYKDALQLKPIEFTSYSEDQLPVYAHAVRKQQEEGKTDAAGERIDIPASQYSGFGDDPQAAPLIQTGIGGRTEPILIWNEGTEWIEWTAEIKESGFYQIEVDYFPIEGKRSSIDRALKIDGQFPFNEAQRLSFYRFWKDAAEPVRNRKGDDVRPRQVEAPHWETVRLTDNEGKHAEPFRFYLEKGTHTLRMEMIREPVALSRISLVPPEIVPTYAEVKQQYAQKGYKEAEDTAVKIQAEQADYKTDPTIRRETNSDPITEPAAEGNIRLNVIGDYRWRKGGQSIAWTFAVPQSGLYKIGIKAGQWWGDGLPGYRKIEVDGRVPFRELEEFAFPYDKHWRIDTLGDGEEDYLFYLEEGEHTIRMTVQLGPYREVLQSLMETIRQISDLNRKIIMVTGTKPDLNYRYDLDRRIPNLLDDLSAITEQLRFQIGEIQRLSGKNPAVVQSLKMIEDQFTRMIRNPDSIPAQLEDMTNSQAQLGNWLLSLKEAPLVLDYLIVASPDTTWPKAMSNIFQRSYATFQNFLNSFSKDYNSVGDTPALGEDGKDAVVIDVWVGNGREWAELLKDLADETFTPESGIAVNMNTIPAGQLAVGGVNTLLLAASSGKAPDVAVSVDGLLPVEFAIRDAVVNLNQFADYEEVSQWFLPGALVPFRYNGGDYALPETQDFNILVYRKDILAELHLGIPDTWDDLYQILPVLQRNGMNAFVPPVIDPFLYQHGGQFYNEEGTESGLASPEAYRAFKEWTDLYTNYRIPIQADFFNRMRSGEMPIGLAGYQHYVLLSTAAPELAGRWGIAPAPGKKQLDGTVDRSAGGALKATVIFRQSEHPNEAWQFLKWWMSKETQQRFGLELESLLGVEARWNSANAEAFQELPWPKEDLMTFQEQWKWFKEPPVVLGGYFTNRHLTNAWNRVVMSGMNPRESLEQAVKDINRELEAKQEEYGFGKPR
ncbi:extracellular solute-binding protein [Paenibacillus sp. 32O-W]|uniref:extracellular solute-binding protein n=1 Tax=Paenibacillus sp. 32O-W TaxID=1695218 RepID=UPI0011A55B07|nr:extracellular solute-binding protein [Paenibacillus sp. 32O-W]